MAKKNLKEDSKQMTITCKPLRGEVRIKIAGTGTATIDWGDGKQCETLMLSALKGDELYDNKKYGYKHDFGSDRNVTVTVTGKNITHLGCSKNGVTRLDVSNNTALKVLDCSRNQLMYLDVSHNKSLVELFCGYNQLTELDVSVARAIRYINCLHNPIKNLNVGKNKELVIESNTIKGRLNDYHYYCSKRNIESLEKSKSSISMDEMVRQAYNLQTK